MRKILINRCFGGFGVSLAVKNLYEERTSGKFPPSWNIKRDDPLLVAIVEELGSQASSGSYSKLKVVEIPDDVEWEIAEYDGYEHVAEKHRTWS